MADSRSKSPAEPAPRAKGSANRKRSHRGDSGAGPSAPPQLRAVVEAPAPEDLSPEPEAGAYPCGSCSMTFNTEKSLAGHMRMHPDRPWRGMHPPPVFTREDFADVEHLLNPEGDDDEDDNNDGTGRERRNLNLPDLNRTPSPPSS